MRLYYNPLVPWIWFGAVIMTFGGLVSLTDPLTPRALREHPDRFRH